eukprot:165722_1
MVCIFDSDSILHCDNHQMLFVCLLLPSFYDNLVGILALSEYDRIALSGCRVRCAYLRQYLYVLYRVVIYIPRTPLSCNPCELYCAAFRMQCNAYIRVLLRQYLYVLYRIIEYRIMILRALCIECDLQCDAFQMQCDAFVLEFFPGVEFGR